MVKEENELLPYVLSELPPGPWIVFAPHPDDETFGMGGSLLLARQKNIETHVVFVTDGAQGGSGDRQALIEKRVEEAREAAAALQIDTIHFFAEPDRGLTLSQDLFDRVTGLMQKVQPRSVFFPTPMEYHPDHRKTAELVWACARSNSGFDTEAYSYEISNLAPINVLIDVSSVAEMKYEAVKIYASQLTQAKYLALVQAVDTARTFSLPIETVAAEGFFHYADKSRSLMDQYTETIPPFFEGIASQ